MIRPCSISILNYHIYTYSTYNVYVKYGRARELSGAYRAQM